MRRPAPKTFLGSVLLISVVALCFWLPLLWWLSKYVLSEAHPIAIDFPFAPFFLRTVTVSSTSASLAIIAAYPLVLLWRLSREFIRKTMVGLMVIPLIMGLLARNYSWIAMLSSSSVSGSLGWSLIGGQKLLFSVAAVYIVMTCIFVPVAFFMLIQGAISIRREHIEAAQTLGVSDAMIVVVVMIPQTLRAAALAFGLIFTMAVGYFVTPRMIGGGKMDFVGNGILAFVNFGNFETASAIALRFLAIMIIPAVIVAFVAMRRRMLVSGR